jgi:hypothetical protein
MIHRDTLVKDLNAVLARPPADTIWRVAVLEAGDVRRTPLYTSGPKAKTFGAGTIANLLVAEAGQQAGLAPDEPIHITEDDLVRHNRARPHQHPEPAPQGRGPEVVPYATALTRLLGENDAITQRAIVRTLGGPGEVNRLATGSPIGIGLKFSGLSPHAYHDVPPTVSYGPGQTIPYETGLLFNHLVTACHPMYRTALSTDTTGTDGLLRHVPQPALAEAAPHLL